jgi:hypothetical protein
VKLRSAIIAAIAVVGVLTPVASGDAPMTKRQAKALAQSLELTTADMPGYESSRVETSRQDRKAENDWLTCAGAVPLNKTLAELYGRGFEAPDSIAGSRDYAFVEAIVKVQRSVALARRDLARVRSARGKKCERKYGISTPDEGYFKVSIKDLPDPAPGAWLQRVKARYGDFSGHVVRAVADLLWFRRGRVEFVLGFSSGGRQPFPAAEEQRVFNLMLARAQQLIP